MYLIKIPRRLLQIKNPKLIWGILYRETLCIGRLLKLRRGEEAMITYQVIQTSIDELKAITKVDFIVRDLSGYVVASTMDDEIMDGKALESFAASPADSQVIQGNHLFKIKDQGEICFILITRGIDDNAFMMGKIAE